MTFRLFAASVAVAALGLAALAVQASSPAWVARSNQNAQVLLQVMERYSPEEASSLGISRVDDQISIPTLERDRRRRADLAAAQAQLEQRLGQEQDPLVKQDLSILIAAADRMRHDSEVMERLLVPYESVAGQVFEGLRVLLDDQVAPDRRKAALVRLRKYTGMEPGFTATASIVEQNFRAKAGTPGLTGPSRVEVEKDLTNTNTYIAGIGHLFEKYKLTGYQNAYGKLKQQLLEYDVFIRKEVLPRSRTDFRLPPEIYKVNLADDGVDYTPEELTKLAHAHFDRWQADMQTLAAKIARARHLPASDYRQVVQVLKKEQIPGDQIMTHYKKRLAEIEDIIRREHLVTLPDRPAIIRLASAAETAAEPAPHMDPPPLVNNHGERGEFVLPLETNGQGGQALKYDDFTFAAASWTLTAHEARPGHELQFDEMVERGVSLARAVFAFNSVNAEGWGLYSEWFMQPYMSDEGRLISLQFQLLRAARAFIDPELQQGRLTPAQAMNILEHDVVISKAFATEEVERFTFRSPGQAVSYFDGYLRLRAIRARTEKALGPKFNTQRFHDFILSQGLLPPGLLEKAVETEFLKEQ